MPPPETLLARGRTADVYADGPAWVLKLFHPPRNLAFARFERSRALAGQAAAQAAGLPAAAVGDAFTVAGRAALRYGRLDGPPLAAEVMRRPWRAAAVGRTLAEVHARLHAAPLPPNVQGEAELPALRARLDARLEHRAVPPDLAAAARAALAALPDAPAVYHGDLHPLNILMTPAGPAVIDWLDAAAGHPLADVARTGVLLREHGRIAAPHAAAEWAVRRTLHAAYLRRYRALAAGRFPASMWGGVYRRWWGVIAAARLAEEIPHAAGWLAAQARAALR